MDRLDSSLACVRGQRRKDGACPSIVGLCHYKNGRPSGANQITAASCTDTCTRTSTHACIHTHMHAHTDTHICMHTPTHTYTRITSNNSLCMYRYTHKHMHTRMHIHTHFSNSVPDKRLKSCSLMAMLLLITFTYSEVDFVPGVWLPSLEHKKIGKGCFLCS